MKKIIKAVLIVAILNILAVLGFVGWLASSGRISKDRLVEATALFGEDPVMRAERIEAERLAALHVEEVETVPEGDIRDADQRNEARVEVTMIDRERLERLQREVRDLQGQLRQQRIMLERERDDFEAKKAEFNAMRERLTELEGGKAFKKALEVLTGMKPADIRPVLTELMQEGKTEEVIAYLAAFDGRLRPKVVSEFVKAGEVDVAADLLESLRTRGLEPVDPGVNTP